MGRVLFVVIFVSMARGVAAIPDLSALKPRIDPTTLPRVPAACVDGKSGWRVVPERAPLIEALKAFGWRERHYQAPQWDCRLHLEVLCGPDLDGDRSNDFMARVRWSRRADSAKGKSCAKADAKELVRHEAILVMRRQKTWRAVDVVSYSIDNDKAGLAEARVDFVQLPDGKIGFRCKTQTEKRGAGCRVLGYWVGALVGGRVKKLGEADPEFCTPD